MTLIFLIIIFTIIIFISIKYYSNKKKNPILKKHSCTIDINKQYDSIVKEMRSSVLPVPNNIRVMNTEEEIFIKTFLEKVQYIRKKYYISLIRYSNGHLMILYNSNPVGRIGFRTEQKYMQVLKGTYSHKEYYNLTFDECLDKIDDFTRYIKYHLREQRF